MYVNYVSMTTALIGFQSTRQNLWCEKNMYYEIWLFVKFYFAIIYQNKQLK